MMGWLRCGGWYGGIGGVTGERGDKVPHYIDQRWLLVNLKSLEFNNALSFI